MPAANQYRIETSRQSDFSHAISSGWLAQTQHVFTGLEDGATYFYRVQCRSNSTRWSQTLPAQFATNENVHVSRIRVNEPAQFYRLRQK